MVKVIAQQERQALRRTKGEAGGPKDDLELEREALLEAQRAAGCGVFDLHVRGGVIMPRG